MCPRLVLVVIAITALTVASPARADDWKDCANVSEEETAIAACSRLIAQKRLSRIDRATVYSNRGAAYLNLGDYDLALKDLNEAIHLDGQSGHAYYNRGVTFFFTEDYEKAILDLNRTLRLDRSDFQTYLYRGRSFLALGRLDSAIKDFTAGISLEPKSANLYRYRGEAFQEKGDYNSAIADYTQALRLNPGLTGALLERAHAYLHIGRLPEALSDTDLALSAKPEWVAALVMRGAILERMARREEALAMYEAALRQEPDHEAAGEGAKRLRSPPPAKSDGNRTLGSRSHLANCNAETGNWSIAGCTEAIRQDPNNEVAYYNRAHLYNEEKKYDLAIADFTKAIEIASDPVSSLNDRGFTYYLKGDYENAIADLSRAITLRPSYSVALNNRGSVYVKRGEFDRAIADLTKAIEISPESVNAYLNRAFAYNSVGDYDRAISDADKAIALEPSIAAYVTRADSRFRRGEFAGVIADLSEVIGRDPEHAWAYNNRAVAFEKAGDLDSALADVNKAIALQPKFARAYINRGILYKRKGDLQGALQEYGKAIELDPSLADAYYNRSKVYFEMKDYTRTVSDAGKAIELQPEFPAAYLIRGQARIEEGALDSAISDLSRAIELDPEDEEAYTERGRAYSLMNQHDRAIENFDTAIRINPNDASAYFLRGVVRFMRLNSVADALVDFTAATRLAPQSERAFYMRAAVLHALGRFEEALADAERALELNPLAVRAHIVKAEALSHLGRKEESIASARWAMELDPSFAATGDALERHEINRSGVGQPDADAIRKPEPSVSRAADAARPHIASGSNRPIQPRLRDLVVPYNGMGLLVLEKLASASPVSNVLLSPLSIGSAMAMLQHGAVGETEREMRRVLQHTLSRHEIAELNGVLLSLLTGERTVASRPLPDWAHRMNSPLSRGPAIDIKLANGLAMGPGKRLETSYVSDLTGNFGAQVLNDASIESINRWVRQQTAGRIFRILDHLDPKFVAVLLNALSLTARWESPFNPSQTLDRPFTTFGGERKPVPTMRQVADFPVVVANGLSAIRIPYADPAIQMVVVVPENPRLLAPDNLLVTLGRQLNPLLSQLERAAPQKVELLLPKFNVSFKSDLVNIFEQLGMSRPFSASRAEFDAMLGRRAALQVDQIQHQVMIEVGELGTEAASATAVAMGPGSGRETTPQPLVFRVDRPFLFLIGDDKSGALMFMGLIKDPTNR